MNLITKVITPAALMAATAFGANLGFLFAKVGY